MKVTHQFLQLKDFRGDKDGPRALVPRKTKTEVWYVPAEPVQPGVPPTYAMTRQGESVLVRLQKVTLSQDPAYRYAFLMGLAVHAAEDVPASIGRMHVVIGRPLETNDAGEVAWVGFAFQVKQE